MSRLFCFLGVYLLVGTVYRFFFLGVRGVDVCFLSQFEIPFSRLFTNGGLSLVHDFVHLCISLRVQFMFLLHVFLLYCSTL